MNIVLTTGGTGGHIFPALAVAEALREIEPQAAVVFVGGAYGPEGRMVQRAGLPFVGLGVRGVIGRGLRGGLAAARLGWACLRATGLLRALQPGVVVGFGGYAGFPAVAAARVLGIPCAIHEQNSIPGAANRWLARWVDRIWTSFPDMEDPYFSGAKVVCTGNPVRRAVCAVAQQHRPSKRRLLVVGGSQGARALNDLMIAHLPRLRAEGVQIWHQTGPEDLERVQAAYRSAYPEARVEAFIDAMDAAYDFADIVLCRAGATTIAELTAAGKPSILVPFPYATHDHQTKNAQALAARGAALVVPQSVLPTVDLVRMVVDLLAAPERLSAMAKAAASMGRPQAAQILAREIVHLASLRGTR
jgi:UDP-N-acetylglucosamine--N-acetylmuramyl-(pentapeptide) pyrophosphoryl-undecaprenol N-acetylglucosamine transferase